MYTELIIPLYTSPITDIITLHEDVKTSSAYFSQLSALYGTQAK